MPAASAAAASAAPAVALIAAPAAVGLRGVPAARLLLVDAMAVVRRAWRAVDADDGPDRAAVALEAARLRFEELVREQSATHFLAAFDAAAPTWRHRLHPAFRNGRGEIAPALAAELPAFIDRLSAAGLAAIEAAGFEADDVIATVAVRACARAHFEVVIASADSGPQSLLREGLRVINPHDGSAIDAAWVERHHGVAPAQLPHYLALAGERLDGIAAVAGITPEQAAGLVRRYGSLDAVLAAAAAKTAATEQDTAGQPRADGARSRAPEGVAARLAAGAPGARLAFKLATLRTDVPVRCTPRDLAVGVPHRAITLAAPAGHEPDAGGVGGAAPATPLPRAA